MKVKGNRSAAVLLNLIDGNLVVRVANSIVRSVTLAMVPRHDASTGVPQRRSKSKANFWPGDRGVMVEAGVISLNDPTIFAARNGNLYTRFAAGSRSE